MSVEFTFWYRKGPEAGLAGAGSLTARLWGAPRAPCSGEALIVSSWGFYQLAGSVLTTVVQAEREPWEWSFPIIWPFAMTSPRTRQGLQQHTRIFLFRAHWILQAGASTWGRYEAWRRSQETVNTIIGMEIIFFLSLPSFGGYLVFVTSYF